MTGGTQQFARVCASIPMLTPITSGCIPVDSDKCATLDDEQWFALMTEKYGPEDTWPGADMFDEEAANEAP